MHVIGHEKKRGIQVQIKDPVNNTSRSFTVHGIDYTKLFCHLLHYTKTLEEFEDITLVCHKRGDLDSKQEEG